MLDEADMANQASTIRNDLYDWACEGSLNRGGLLLLNRPRRWALMLAVCFGFLSMAHAQAQAQYALGKTTQELPKRGGNGGQPAGPLKCDDGYVVTGIHGTIYKLRPARLGLICRRLNADGTLGDRKTGDLTAPPKTAPPKDVNPDDDFYHQCGQGEVVVGFYGWSDPYIDQLGFWCAKPEDWMNRKPPTRGRLVIGSAEKKVESKDFDDKCDQYQNDKKRYVVTQIAVQTGWHLDQEKATCTELTKTETPKR